MPIYTPDYIRGGAQPAAGHEASPSQPATGRTWHDIQAGTAAAFEP